LAISTQTFTQYVSNAVAAIQGASRQLVDLSVGSVLLAAVQATAAIALWLQGIALQIAALTRFSSSFGADADSWGADFGYGRLGALFAKGQVTFSRFTPTNQATVNLGTLVQTADGTQGYAVIADTTQPTFNAGINAYVIPAGTPSASVTVQSVNAALAANVAAGSITILAQSAPFVDTVSNAAPMAGGADAETDTAYHARFPRFLASLSNATPTAIRSAAQSVGANVQFTFTENLNPDGSAHPGFFFVVADDGSGAPPSSFITAVAAAIEAVRGTSITYGVFPPTKLFANVAMTIVTASGFVHSTVAAAVSAALTSYINALPIGAPLPYAVLSSIAFGVAGVSNVPLSLLTLNGGTTDLVPTAQQLVKTGSVTVL
jgi:uncharacterized phage protein gp47/JayE